MYESVYQVYARYSIITNTTGLHRVMSAGVQIQTEVHTYAQDLVPDHKRPYEYERYRSKEDDRGDDTHRFEHLDNPSVSFCCAFGVAILTSVICFQN